MPDCAVTIVVIVVGYAISSLLLLILVSYAQKRHTKTNSSGIKPLQHCVCQHWLKQQQQKQQQQQQKQKQ